MTAEHGTQERYGQGCTCTACVLGEAERENERRIRARRKTADHARTIRSARRRQRNGYRQPMTHTLATGELAVECWCHDRIVYVTPELVQRGLTGSCGAASCKEAIWA